MKAAPSRNTSACQSAESRTLPANSPSSSGSGGKWTTGVADADSHSHWSRAPHAVYGGGITSGKAPSSNVMCDRTHALRSDSSSRTPAGSSPAYSALGRQVAEPRKVVQRIAGQPHVQDDDGPPGRVRGQDLRQAQHLHRLHHRRGGRPGGGMGERGNATVPAEGCPVAP